MKGTIVDIRSRSTVGSGAEPRGGRTCSSAPFDRALYAIRGFAWLDVPPTPQGFFARNPDCCNPAKLKPPAPSVAADLPALGPAPMATGALARLLARELVQIRFL